MQWQWLEMEFIQNFESELYAFILECIHVFTLEKAHMLLCD